MKVRKELRQYFVNRVEKVFKEFGVYEAKGEHLGYQYKLNTKAGFLYLMIPDESWQNDGYFDVFAKFINPEDAYKKIRGVDSINGKWNFHFKLKEKTKEYIDRIVSVIYLDLKQTLE